MYGLASKCLSRSSIKFLNDSSIGILVISFDPTTQSLFDILVLKALVVLFNTAGCSMISTPWAKAKGLVGIEVPVPTCEGETCEDIRG